MDRFRLECFVAVAEELHFRRAAERCHVSQSAMSQQFRTLEQELDVRLAHRTKRSVTLTPAGEQFLREARRTIRQMDRAADVARRVDRGESGQLTVGVTAPAAYILLPEVATRFRRRLPQVGLEVVGMSTAQAEQALRDGDIDVGLVHPPLTDPGLVVDDVARMPYVLALPEGHRLAARSTVAFAELAGERFVMFPRSVAPMRYDSIVALARSSGFGLDIATETYPAQSIIGLVGAGIGLGFIASRVQRLDRPGVVYRRIRGDPIDLRIGVARPGGSEPAPVVEAFLAAARTAGRRVR